MTGAPSRDLLESFYRDFRRLRAGRVLSVPAPPHGRVWPDLLARGAVRSLHRHEIWPCKRLAAKPDRGSPPPLPPAPALRRLLLVGTGGVQEKSIANLRADPGARVGSRALFAAE